MHRFNCPKLLAHRGLSQLAPENTMAAFVAAQQAGFHWIEFDVMLTKDLHPVIFHDEKLNRTTNGGKALLAHKTYEQLRHLDAGSWFDKAFSGEPIPDLKQVIEFMKTHQMKAVVEIKPTEGQDVKTAEKTIAIIQKYWPEGLNHMIFASFSLASLITVRRLLPRQAIGAGLHQWRKESFEYIKALDCYSIHVNHLLLSAKRMEILRETGCHVLAYTVNHSKQVVKLKNLGVDGFFSDCPDKL